MFVLQPSFHLVFIFPSIQLFICLPIFHPSICPNIQLSILLFPHPSINLSGHLPFGVSILHPSFFPWIHCSICVSIVYPSICPLSFHPSILSFIIIHLSDRFSVDFADLVFEF
ncbi:hypothetical protein ILYODFUR_020236 [Ilyodon furcidens]|uniref:Uncharacterized protein n=1 Tax=Ilyodon furcidens TaxID=33524 RepID=A0ABV0SMU3_9TELE